MFELIVCVYWHFFFSFRRILTTITERWELLESSVSTRSETQRRITEADSWLTTAQEDIKRLSQPIGYSVEDAQTALKQYEVRSRIFSMVISHFIW